MFTKRAARREEGGGRLTSLFSLFSLFIKVASEVLSNFNEWQGHAKRLQEAIDDDDDDVDVDVGRKT